jgi:hypothetical protein
MPKTVTVPGVGDIDFPDAMSDHDVVHAIETDILPNAGKTIASTKRLTAPRSPKNESVSFGEGAEAIGAGILQGLGVRIPSSLHEFLEDEALNLFPPARGASQVVEMVQSGADYIRQARAAGSRARAASKVVGAVPIVGPPISDLTQPAVTYSEGRAPTKEENLGALRGGAALGTMAVLPEVSKRVATKMAAKGAGAPAATALVDVTDTQANEPVAHDETPRTGNAPSLPDRESADFGPALRTLFTGERDVRSAEANQLAEKIRKLVPDHVDQEALTLMRDFKGKPEELRGFLDRASADVETSGEKAAPSQLERLRPVIERAMNPTPAMKAADAALDSYFTRTLQEGRDLGFLDSGIDPQAYINHLLLPKDAEEGATAGMRSGGVNRFTPFAKERHYPTVLDAVTDGASPRTLNAADALSIYGDKHGTAAATRVLVNTLKSSELAKWATDSTAPRDWAEVGPGTRSFRNEVAFKDSETGEPRVAHQALYAPKDVIDALRPITDPDWTGSLPGFRNTKLYQSYLKSVELGLSVFHMRALNITALNNEGLAGLAKSYGADVESPSFIENERTFLRAGGTTSVTGRTLEAYRSLQPKSLPSRLDTIRNLPVFRQLDQLAAETSRLTFDVMQRKMKVTSFAIKNAKWIAEHPESTPGDHAAAQRSIAKEINAAYGGLNWEALGVNRATHSLAKALFLAPDWTFSNWQTAKTAFEGTPGGAAARAFWLRSAIVGIGLTQAASMLLSGKSSDNPTQVHLGKDPKGKDIYQNIFFAGAPSDLVNLIGNVKDFGAVEGTALTVANKLAPLVRAGIHAATNKNFLGRDIVPRGAGPIAGTGRAVLNLGSDLVPIPFSASNIVQMLTDPQRQYTPVEYATTLLTGVRSRHVRPPGQNERPRNSTWDIITGSPVHRKN